MSFGCESHEYRADVFGIEGCCLLAGLGDPQRLGFLEYDVV